MDNDQASNPDTTFHLKPALELKHIWKWKYQAKWILPDLDTPVHYNSRDETPTAPQLALDKL